MKAPKINTKNLTYFNITKHWRKIKPFIASPEGEHIWRKNMEDFDRDRRAEHGWPPSTLPHHYPSHYDGDWRCERPGRTPEWWHYVCAQACHFLVDLNLYAAINAFPNHQWRIVTQRHHSTVWNGDCKNPVLFDMNFLAIGICPKQAWKTASKGRMLKPGKPLNWHRYIGKEFFV